MKVENEEKERRKNVILSQCCSHSYTPSDPVQATFGDAYMACGGMHWNVVAGDFSICPARRGSSGALSPTGWPSFLQWSGQPWWRQNSGYNQGPKNWLEPITDTERNKPTCRTTQRVKAWKRLLGWRILWVQSLWEQALRGNWLWSNNAIIYGKVAMLALCSGSDAASPKCLNSHYPS